MIKKFFKSHPIHKKIVPLFDSLMIIRPTLFFSVWVMVCIGMYIGMILKVGFGNIPMNVVEFSYRAFTIFFGISLVCASTFILNQLSDIDGDKINKKLLIVGNVLSEEKALTISKITAIIGFISIFFVSWIVGFPMLLLYLLWGRLYNHEKYNWKSNPWLGLLCNVSCGYFLILSGILYVNDSIVFLFSVISSSLIYTIPFLFAYFSVVLLANIPDFEGDNLTKKKTFTVIYGVKNTIIFSTFMCIGSLVLGLYLWDPLSSTAALSALPFFLFTVFRGENKDIIRSIRYPILLLNFYVLTIYPLLLFPVIISYYLTKYYYWHRFSVHYPTLLVDDD